VQGLRPFPKSPLKPTNLMKYNPDYHHRRSIRLPHYDYARSGIYFVTICTHQRQCLFGEICDGKMSLNQIGKIVAQEWLKSSQIRQEIELDEWIIMPNHLHGIVAITANDKDANHDTGANNDRGASLAPLQRNGDGFGRRKPRSLSSFILDFKSSVTKRIKEICEESILRNPLS
jgi:REP element-mobilizing transposase RayT